MTTITLSEIQDFIDRVADPLGWTRQYTNLVATTANAVSDALFSEVIEIDATAVDVQLAAVKLSLESRGKSLKTAGTYASVWRRLSGLLADWHSAITNDVEDDFWSSFADTYRDPRIARRRSGVHRLKKSPATISTTNLISAVINGDGTVTVIIGDISLTVTPQVADQVS
jgi:hypothetical protein